MNNLCLQFIGLDPQESVKNKEIPAIEEERSTVDSSISDINKNDPVYEKLSGKKITITDRIGNIF